MFDYNYYNQFNTIISKQDTIINEINIENQNLTNLIEKQNTLIKNQTTIILFLTLFIIILPIVRRCLKL